MIRSAGKLLVLWAFGAFCAGACGGEGSSGSQVGMSPQTVSVPADLLDLLETSVTAPWTTAFSGVRRVEVLAPGAGGGLDALAYREQVAADGAGHFSVEPLELLSFVPDPQDFEELQKARAGLLYRYRDFAIRDLGAFFASYQVIDQGQELTVAGRTCRVVEIQRLDGSGSIYDVAFDAATGLVLRYAERSVGGQPLGLMEFESYTAEPDFSGVAWYTTEQPETALPLVKHFGSQLHFEPLQPSILPDGYVPWKAATVVDDQGHLWLKQTFTDGVEPLFFFHRDGPVGAVVPGPLGGPSGSAGPTSGATGIPDDELWVYPIGRMTAVQGVLRQREVIALGKVDDETLLDLLEFAVDG